MIKSSPISQISYSKSFLKIIVITLLFATASQSSLSQVGDLSEQVLPKKSLTGANAEKLFRAVAPGAKSWSADLGFSPDTQYRQVGLSCYLKISPQPASIEVFQSLDRSHFPGPQPKPFRMGAQTQQKIMTLFAQTLVFDNPEKKTGLWLVVCHETTATHWTNLDSSSTRFDCELTPIPTSGPE
jgi:hypothetical protein